MRWLVEVTSLGKTERDSLYVDADSWQKALQVARTLRGETDPMSGFSIELLEEGCRAVDPTTRMSYEVHRAPDDGRAQATRASVVQRPSAATPDASAAAASAPAATAPAGTAPAPAATATMPAPAPTITLVPSAPIAPAPSPGQAWPPPTMAMTQPLVAAHPPTQPVPTPIESASRSRSPFPPRPQISHAATMAIGSPAPPPVGSVAPAPHGAGSVSPPSSLPSQIVFKREQDATEALPLTYREYVYVVPPGSTEMAAASLVQSQLELVRASLGWMQGGKLVNLAVFDVAFQGRPPVPPLVTLSWKDWRGVALVSFPRQPGRAPLTIPTGTAPATLAPPALPPAPTLAQAFAPAQTFPASQAPVPVTLHAPSFVPAAPVQAPAPSFVPAAPAFTPAQTQPLSSAPHAPGQAQPFAAAAAQPFALSPQAFADAALGFAPPQQTFSPPPVFAQGIHPVPPPQVSVPLASPGAQEPVLKRASYVPYPQAVTAPPVPATPAARIYGEDLIADLFEAMHDLHFSRDAVEGGDFCLALAMAKLPSLAGIVELYDINRREFLVTSTRGDGTSKLLLRRFPETDGMLAAAMRRRRAMVIGNAIDSEAATNERYVAIGGARSLIVAPVMQSGRYLGVIELVNPVDGQPFTESDGNAVTYIAEQFAEFVATRGVVTDPERIGARPPH